MKHNKAPEYVLCALSLRGLTDPECFWNRFVYFHLIDRDVLADMQEQLPMFGDLSVLGVANIHEFKKEIWLYRMYTPQKYGSMFLNSIAENILGGSRYKINLKNYRETVENKGHIFFGTKDYCDEELPAYAGMKSFCVDEVMDYYFRKMIDLCEENHIRFVFQSPPYNTSTHIRENVIDEYKAYLDGIQKAYPNAVIDQELCWLGPECFGDAGHTNQKGMEQYCLLLTQEYPEIFKG